MFLQLFKFLNAEYGLLEPLAILPGMIMQDLEEEGFGPHGRNTYSYSAVNILSEYQI